jgi:simple sugar transport system substrate-binding protein
VPYFNWGPGYLQLAQEVRQGTWESHWEWAGPDWRDINNPETSAVGFFKGSALGEEHSAQLDEVVDGLANGSLVFFKGPLRFQNGEVYLAEGEVATDEQIWYMPHLLEKMEGLSE